MGRSIGCKNEINKANECQDILFMTAVGILGIELQDLQKKIDHLHSPSDPKKVAQMLSMQREVTLLQFEAAVRHSVR